MARSGNYLAIVVQFNAPAALAGADVALVELFDRAHGDVRQQPDRRGDDEPAIQTRGQEDQVEITIRDNGRGMSAEEADNVFDPSFKVADGRVSSGNWSLFNSRQIVYEHGGDIRVETAAGRGTAMHITLPVV